jgi:uncharacterized membrane protein
MTDPVPPAQTPAPLSTSLAQDDRVFPIAVYILYLLGLMNGVTVLIGVVMAYALRNKASELHRTHYIFQIRTFWIGLFVSLFGCVLAGAGFPLVWLFGFGFILWGLAGIVFAAMWVWFLVRSVLGLIKLAQGEPYPRPYAFIA